MALPPRGDEDWQIAYANAQSKLLSTDTYGPAPGQCYVKQGQDTESSLIIVRNLLEAMWKDYDFNDMPEAVACLDRILDDLEAE